MSLAWNTYAAWPAITKEQSHRAALSHCLLDWSRGIAVSVSSPKGRLESL